uniref:protein-tyrosine-phosphatase n=1 Tax=Amphimedon queenslandica TaxID=400682 RepID=A0A1X7TVJ3_AMPQE
GYKEKKAFIIAESPMFNTARNFWKMIDDRNVTAIVMLCHEKEIDQEVCYQYWPSTPSGLVIGEYAIMLSSEEIYNGYIERKLEVKNTNTGSTQSVMQYQITNWVSTRKMAKPQTILSVIEEMYKTQRRRGNTSIVVHCSDTVGRSAMFCAAATTINKCKTEGVIDVFQVLKSQRIQKPGSVQTVEVNKNKHCKTTAFQTIASRHKMKPSNSTCYFTVVWCLLAQVGEGKALPSIILPSNRVQLYLSYVDRIIPDYSMIYASQFYDVNQNNDHLDTNDALWCQSANNVTNIGVWYYPNGTEVPLFDGAFGDLSVPIPVYSKRFSGQIALARRGDLSGYEGLYKCIIPDKNGVNQTLVVGAYTDTGYNNNDGPDADPTMQFSLLSTSRLATPPVFSLSFNVSDGPPTTVSCSVNGSGISTELSRVPVVDDFMATLITTSVMTLTWSPPIAVVPTSYNINRRCRRVCDSSVTSNSTTSISSPHTSTGIPSYSQCGFDLIGVYGTDLPFLTTNYLATTLSTVPTAQVDDIIFSSVESVSMTVSWDEVPCNGRNGPITGYYLTYTNITSNTSYTVNITGGDNRMYNLTGLIPYTNYTVSIIPYNYNMNGPARQEIQLTTESIPGVISDLGHSSPPTEIVISWNPPTIPNGIITVYEIRYRESTSTDPYNIINTTNTYYSILGLIPNTSYTIGVRAYTSIGPGEWTDREYTSIEIPVIQTFSITKINSTAVRAEWGFVSGASHYTVYYESTNSSSRKKRQVETEIRVFPGDTTEGLIGGLDPNLNYLFSISISYNVNGIIYEGERTQPIPPSVTVTGSSTRTSVVDTSIMSHIDLVPSITVIQTISTSITSLVPSVTMKKTTGGAPMTSIISSMTAFTAMSVSKSSTPMLPTTDGSSMTIIFIAAGAIVPLLLIVIIIVITIVVVLISNRRYSRGNLQYCKGAYTPVIEEFPNDMTSEEGRQVLFKVKVKVRGNSKPSFNWYHNGEPVTDDYAHELRGDGSLLLVSVEEKHKGTYRFVANNDAGTVSQQVVLTVAVEGSDESRLLHGDSSSAKIDMIPVDKFGEFVANGHAKGNEGFRNQFGMLDSGESDHTVTVGLTPSNKLLNRFANIVVYDDNRITLRPMPGHKDCTNEYINACFIKDYSNQYQYIATQGPVSNTLVDFWQLIWQEKSTIIVMITNIIEEGKVKCQQYWPNSDTKDYGPFSVTLREHPDYINAVFIN